MPFSISNIVDYNRFIALDIGSSKIKVLICSIESGELRVLGSSIVRESKKNIIDGEIADLYGVSESIKKAISQAGKDLDEVPNDIVISLSSPLTLTDTISMNYIRDDKDIPITMEEIDSAVKKIEHKSFERIKSKAELRVDVIGSEMKLVTTSITSITVDGQKLSNPVGFTGKNIRLRIINIFVPISYANMIQNIGRGLGKNIISLIPTIITLPKLIEETDENFDYNCFLDFGHTKTTIVIENNGEIIGGNTLNYGFSLLEEEFRRKEPKLSYLDIEHIITHMEEKYPKYSGIIDPFFDILFDGIFVAMTDITKQLFLKNIYVSGGGVSDFLKKRLEEYAKTKSIGNYININDICTGENKEYAGILANVYSLAKTTQEMLLLKKDPIARILRYIIYRYE